MSATLKIDLKPAAVESWIEFNGTDITKSTMSVMIVSKAGEMTSVVLELVDVEVIGNIESESVTIVPPPAPRPMVLG